MRLLILTCALVAAPLGCAHVSKSNLARAAAIGTAGFNRAGYEDRGHAIWVAQIAAVLLTWPHEHQTASVLWLTNYPRVYRKAPVDDDWYYEMVAVRAFERYGIQLTPRQLGELSVSTLTILPPDGHDKLFARI